ncbi:LysR family transcriptional regulator [Tissierella sp.]|uniref:LysR family transcriptional regulator n=1 Tax=Tissierella sp. TaxID=41274 RepID=UPI00285CC94D|nr:LysR family transcriptional regulator [Tissierella sp.]MDR7855328.1 LysR family transcriptional regulator [Tissierella sp.]
MKISQIEVIVEIAKAGSISGAAQNLFISQPGVSKILKKFEEEIGIQIFERVSTGIRLTPIGRRFVDNAQDILDQVDKLEYDLFKRKSVTAFMELNIASMSYHFMQHMIPELYNKYSKNPINIRYTECGFDDQLELINKGEVEIGIVTFWHNDLKKIINKALAKGVEYRCLGGVVPYIGVSKSSRNYPEEIKGLELRRLADMPIIAISPSSPSKVTGWEFMRQIFGRSKLETSNKEIITNNTGTMRGMVCKTDGFSLILLNNGIYERYGFFDDIRLIPIPGENMQFEMGWLQRTNTVRSPLANEFINILGEYTSEY